MILVIKSVIQTSNRVCLNPFLSATMPQKGPPIIPATVRTTEHIARYLSSLMIGIKIIFMKRTK